MLYRVQTEIENRLNKMQPPEPTFKALGDLSDPAIAEIVLKRAFESGYNQALKEMKEFFEVK